MLPSSDPRPGELGRSPTRLLRSAFMTATSMRSVVDTAIVLYTDIRARGLSRSVTGGDRSPLRRRPPPTDAGLAVADLATTPSDAPGCASVLRLREVAWYEGTRPWRPRPRSVPVVSTELVLAVRTAIVEAQHAGLPVANTAQLLVGLTADPDSTAAAFLRCAGVDPARFVDEVRRSPAYGGRDPAWLPAVQDLRTFGVLPEPGFLRWLSGKMGQRGFGWPGGYGNGVLPVVLMEVRRQAVLAGRAIVSTVDILLAISQLDAQLAAAGRHLPERWAARNAGGAILSRHGFDDERAARLPFTPVEEFEPYVRPTRLGRLPDPTADPAWSEYVAGVFDLAWAEATRRNDPDTGTTHLLLSLLAWPTNDAVELLSALGVDLVALRSDVVASLSDS